MNTSKYVIVFFSLLFISEILQAQEDPSIKEQLLKKNTTQETESTQQTKKSIPKSSTDKKISSTNFSHQTTSPNQLFTQVFIHHKSRSEYDLIKAAARGDLNNVKFLVTIGANVNIQDKDMPWWSWTRISAWTPLMHALHRDDLDMAQLLVESGADVNQENRDGMTALMKAAENNDIEGIKFLKKSGADVNQQNRYGVTPLMVATMSNNIKAAELLKEYGADVNLKNEYNTTALIMAATMGHIEFVRLLISFGADIHLRDKSDWTALMHTYEFFPKIFKLLEENGAKLTPEDQQKLSKKPCVLQLFRFKQPK